jgi:hypothetical protein
LLYLKGHVFMSETVREPQHEGQEGAGTDSSARILSQGTAGAQVTVANVARDAQILSWHSSAQLYLSRLGMAEYAAGIDAHIRAGRSRRTYRHRPSEYHSALIRLLGRNDESGFKARKLMSGGGHALGF